MKAPRAKGNAREDEVVRLFSSVGRYSIVRRGSGAVSTVRKILQGCYVAGDVIVLPDTMSALGVQIEVGGPGKAVLKEFSDLIRGHVPGYELAVVLFLPKGRQRWLLADKPYDGKDFTYTECRDFHDFMATIRERAI